MDLPPAGSTSGTQSATGSGGVRLASGTEELGGSAGRITPLRRGLTTAAGGGSVGSFSPRARYAHDPEYGWLRGRLEYSQIDRCWKLRYIPIDGTTDQFGGSVVLPDTSLLSGYERGDFVEVHGTLGRTASEQQGYAPSFQIRQIERLGS